MTNNSAARVEAPIFPSVDAAIPHQRVAGPFAGAGNCPRRFDGDDVTQPTHAPVAQVPFLKLLGVVQEQAAPGRSRIRLPELREDLSNLLPAAHGGVVMTLLDVAMARAATSQPGAPSTTVVTVETSSRFVRPARGPLVAEGSVLHAGGSLCTCEAHLRDAKGHLVATAMGTFKYWRGPVGDVE